MAYDPRPPEFFSRFHERARTRDPDWVYPFVRMLITAPSLALFRARAIDADNVPERGAVILAPNHFSFFDHFLLAVYLKRQVRFMAKSDLFRQPSSFILSHGGTFPVLRGKHDEEAIKTARSIIERGQVLGMYAEGTRSLSGKIGKPKRGLGRVALETGAPVVPVALHGTSEARKLKALRLPAKVTIQYGKPMEFIRRNKVTPEAALEASQAIFEKVREMYDRLDTVGRKALLSARRRSGLKGKGTGAEARAQR